MGKKLRVCHFTYSFSPTVGGMEEVIHKLSLALLSHDCEPYVFAPYVRGKDNRMAAPYKILRFSRPSSRRIGLRQLLIPLLWHHMRFRFDVLHCHGVYPAGYVGASFQGITGTPFVITPHGGDVREDDKGFIINKSVTARIRRTLSSAGAVTAVSADMKSRVLSLGARPDRVHVIPNGVSINEFELCEGRRRRAYDSQPYILYLGRLIKTKGVDVLIRAFAEICKDHPTLSLKIAGDGAEMEALKELARSLYMSEHINFLGTVRGESKVCLLSGALFLACPSREESFGIVNLEAMASGLPVVATKIGGILDVIQDGENGFLIEPDDAGQLTEKMRLLLESHELRQRMSLRALQSVSRFDWSHIIQDYLRVYRDVRNRDIT